MVDVKVEVLAAGYCEQLHAAVFPSEFLSNGSRSVRFYALFALLEHPREGYILFDTGYAEHFFSASRALPYRLYRALIPVTCGSAHSAKAQLKARGIEPHEIRTIIISHFHADHIAGLRDFPEATFICSQPGYEAIKSLRGLAATRHAFLPDLLPPDFEARARFITPQDFTKLGPAESPFELGFDVFGDGSLALIPLEGHARGQLGVLVQTLQERIFFVADAVWHSRALREGQLPAVFTRPLMASWSDYKTTFERLRRFQNEHPNVRLIPSHCAESYEQLIRGSVTKDNVIEDSVVKDSITKDSVIEDTA